MIDHLILFWQRYFPLQTSVIEIHSNTTEDRSGRRFDELIYQEIWQTEYKDPICGMGGGQHSLAELIMFL